MRDLHRVAIYALVTAVIEVPSILILYSLGYPNSPSSNWIQIYMIVENLFFFMLAFSALGGPVPGQGPRDISFDLVWGVVSMFIIVAVVGEAIYWLSQEIEKIKRKDEQRLQSRS